MSTSRSKIRKKLDELVKKVVKERDGYICQHCEKKLEGSNCHGSHVIPVSAGLALAYDPTNLKTLCYHCHINWWHKNPMEAAEWFKNKFPDRWTYLQQKKAEGNKPIKDWQLEELYNEMKLRLVT